MNAPATCYDEIPYESFPYAQTHVTHLFTIGTLFGGTPTSFKHCRVLELGCGGGCNLIPMADEFPQSEFHGIDLSAVQIAMGNKLINEIGLKNIKLETLSITDFPKNAGKFDYIICHGILSWVPEVVQQAIFAIFQHHLTDNGMAYVSYNTLPGWNMVKSLREMMRFHIKRFTDTDEKINQALSLLNFIEEAQPEGGALREVIKNEKQMLDGKPKSYFLHDHLEETNQPFYFYDITDTADKHGLQYIADASAFSSMYLDNYGEKVRQTLEKGSFLEIEQYLDFISNRRFRSSVFIRKEKVFSRNIDANIIKDFYLRANGLQLAENCRAPEPLDNSELTFVGSTLIGKNFTLNSRDKFLSAVFLTLIEHRSKPINFNKLIETANKKYALNNTDALSTALVNFGIRVLFSGGLTIHSSATRAVTEVSKKPLAVPISRALAKQTTALINAYHGVTTVDIFIQFLIRYLDGTNDVAALAEKIIAHTKNGDLTFNQDGNKLTDEKIISEFVNSNIPNALDLLLKNGFLIG